MRLMLTYANGYTVEGLLLAGGREHMRVVVAGKSDTVELVRLGEAWRGDDGETVEIDAITGIDGVDCAQLLAGLVPQTMSAGGCGY